MNNNTIGSTTVRVDIDLLRKQQQYLLTLPRDPDGLNEGLIIMIDHILDQNKDNEHN